MRKAIILILAMVVALSALPITFACYNGGWGNWDRFWRPQQIVYACPTYCSVIITSVNAYDNEDTFTEPKEVAQTTASIQDYGKKLVITIDNAYPGYQGIVDFCVKNTGTLAATITGITINNPNTGYLDLDLTGDCEVGAVIQPWTTKCGQLVIDGIPQLEDAQNRTFTFDITLNFECICLPLTCDTAFARSYLYSTCFSYWGFSNWGWTNGPLQPDEYRFPLYAGAAQCDISKGKHVGWITVNYNGSTAIVTYNMFYGYKMDETHLYVGNEPLPRINGDGEYTVAPGQFPLSHDLDNASTDWYAVTGLSGEIYVVAHAVVCD
ncbi:MAG: hypothetical protein HQ588_04455 [Deltaproteobacteria bacterium]|nr:hypothetical protein [Deltaproteobacteria bacterium]